MTAGSAGLLLPGEGRALSPRGTRVAYKAAGQRAAGEPTVLEFTAVPGFTTGAHVHRAIEELFYVVAGEFEFRVGDRTFRVSGLASPRLWSWPGGRPRAGPRVAAPFPSGWPAGRPAAAGG